MSIFQSKEFWSTSIVKAPDEEFDSNSIAIGNIDNDPKGTNKICISSMKGFLRFFEPHFRGNSSESLLYEKLYDDSILQIAIGNYIINSQDVQLGILQVKKFLVIQVSNLHGATTLKLCFDHKLKFNGHNFTKGRIGDRNYDIVFIQSTDGAISIYEQDSLINIVSFTEVIFPGAIGFLSNKDSFIISNTSYEVECYNYNNLATTKKTSSQGQDRITHQWKANIGELTKDIQIIYNTLTKKEEIVSLSETLLNLIDSNGRITYQRKLDFEPMTFKVYNITDEKYVQNKIFDLMCMIATSANHILIYKGINLAWAVKVYETPIFLSFGDFDHIKSLIVSLSDNGNLSVMYLGMEPVKNMQVVPSKALDPNFIAKETERLAVVIENYNKGVVAAPEDTLSISADVNSNIFFDEEPGDKIFYKDNYGRIFRCQVVLEFSYDGLCASDIRINITCPYNVVCDDPIFTISSLTQKNNTIKKVVNFRVIENLFPTFTNIDIYATYYVQSEDARGEKTFQSTSLSIDLPLSLFLRISHENKKDNNTNKITLCTNKNPLQLPEIFKELTDNYIDSSLMSSKSGFITFIYPNKTEVTIIVSKQNGRYRIQSNYIESLLFITSQLVNKLNEYFEYKIDCYIEDPINFQKLVSIVTNHFELTKEKKKVSQELEKYTSLYTAIQKNLLNKYKVKNPPKLSNLDFLLKQVYKEINNKSDLIANLDNEVKKTQRNIVIWIELVLYLLRLRARLNDEQYQIIRNAFPLDNIHNNENSWEDVTLANMGNLILYYFKEGKENLMEIKEINDLDKWSKYIKTLFKEVIEHKGLGTMAANSQS